MSTANPRLDTATEEAAAERGLIAGVRRLGGRNRTVLARLLPLTGLAGLIVIYWIVDGGRFMSSNNWLSLIQQTAVVGIAGLGMTFVIVSGSIDLSVGSVIALAGIVAAQVSGSSGAVLGVLAGLGVGLACGLCNGFILAVLRVPSFIVTLGMLYVVRGLVYVFSSDAPKIVGGFGGLGSSPGIYWVLAAAAVIAFLLFNATSFGRYTRSIGGDERVSQLSGVPVTRMKIAVFAVAGVMFGLAGVVLSARLGVATPDAATGFELTAIAAVVIGGTPLTGGIGNVWNTLIGALIIQVLLNGLVILGASPNVQEIVQGAVLIVAVLVALERRKIGVIK